MPEGRPNKARRGTETRKKAYLVTSRYDADEFAELEEAASKAGLTRASYQRVQSLSKSKTRSTRRAPIEKELLAKVLGQLGKVGSNLNQIARSSPLDREVGAEVVAALVAVPGFAPLLLS